MTNPLQTAASTDGDCGPAPLLLACSILILKAINATCQLPPAKLAEIRSAAAAAPGHGASPGRSLHERAGLLQSRRLGTVQDH